jgi:hypothetical protein
VFRLSLQDEFNKNQQDEMTANVFDLDTMQEEHTSDFESLGPETDTTDMSDLDISEEV